MLSDGRANKPRSNSASPSLKPSSKSTKIIKQDSEAKEPQLNPSKDFNKSIKADANKVSLPVIEMSDEVSETNAVNKDKKADIADNVEIINVRPKRDKETSSIVTCLLYTSPSPRDRQKSRMPSSA